ncbi:MAG: hypothetical protein GX109_09820 [Bacteroidales bacterium]|jgi:hypothetical protein|nr:hypothetical protein [Bacteroidales bacterium]NLO43303.1 hypothetical protein [Bacteroidales bacterium]
MKRIINILFVASLSFVFFACSNNKKEEVVEKYYTHFLKGEFEEAKKLVTEEHQGLCDLMASFAPEEEKAKMAKTEVSVTNISCEDINDSISICSCQIKTSYEGEEKTIDEKVELKKVGNDWYINQGKESNEDKKDVDQEENMPITASEEEILTEDTIIESNPVE